MGADPAYAFLALSAPPGFDHRRFFTAPSSPPAAATAHARGRRPRRASPNGGHREAHPARNAAREGGRWLRRSGAAPGHELWLGGTVGESAAGTDGDRTAARIGKTGAAASSPRSAHRPYRGPPRRPPPPRTASRSSRSAAGSGHSRKARRWMYQTAWRAISIASAAASGVGAEIDAGALPFAERFAELCAAIDADPLALALGGGEDYVLLFTLPEGIEPPRETAAGGSEGSRRETEMTVSAGRQPLCHCRTWAGIICPARKACKNKNPGEDHAGAFEYTDRRSISGRASAGCRRSP